MEHLENTFTRQDITPLEICNTNLSVKSLVIGESLFSQVHLFLALQLNLGRFGHLVPAST